MFCYLYIRSKTRGFLSQYFGTTSLSEALETSKVEAESTPKSLSGMDSIYSSRIKRDFPHLNINELKSKAESMILKTFDAIENGDKDAFKAYERLNTFINSRIDDYKDNEVHFYSTKVHRTVLNRYENVDGIATLRFQSSVGYTIETKKNGSKKVQTRIQTEFIYIVDEEKVNFEKKALGLNCPNCGAPIKGVGEKKCIYCGSGIEDIVKRSWTMNNLAEF
ncbi:MAG: hypothetical protein IKE73_03145 [Bacilli bacterium]|nr:hypothetical protein [Bacilli bacterium]